jgi:hypothetical protein
LQDVFQFVAIRADHGQVERKSYRRLMFFPKGYS